MQTAEYVREREGELFVGSTRVTLRSVIEDWKRGRTPEQITEDFPSVPLAAVYGSIATYLERREELDQRFAEDDVSFERARATTEAANPAFYADMRARFAKVRPRLEAELREKGILTETPTEPGAAGDTRIQSESPRFLTDENFNLLIVTGLLDVRPRMDILTLQAAGMLHTPDPLVLAYASEQDRILLSHDLRTMPQHFADFFAGLPANRHSPGVILIPQKTPVGAAIQWLLEIWEASRHDEWRDRLTYLPM